LLLTSSNDEKSLAATTSLDTQKLPQVINPVNLNKYFDFAGEEVPMHNFDAKERLDREFLSAWKKYVES